MQEALFYTKWFLPFYHVSTNSNIKKKNKSGHYKMTYNIILRMIKVDILDCLGGGVACRDWVGLCFIQSHRCAINIFYLILLWFLLTKSTEVSLWKSCCFSFSPINIIKTEICTWVGPMKLKPHGPQTKLLCLTSELDVAHKIGDPVCLLLRSEIWSMWGLPLNLSTYSMKIFTGKFLNMRWILRNVNDFEVLL